MYVKILFNIFQFNKMVDFLKRKSICTDNMIGGEVVTHKRDINILICLKLNHKSNILILLKLVLKKQYIL